MKDCVFRIGNNNKIQNTVDLYSILTMVPSDSTSVTIIVEKGTTTTITCTQQLVNKKKDLKLVKINFVLEEYAQLHGELCDDYFALESTITLTVTLHASSICFLYLLCSGFVQRLHMDIILQSILSQITVRAAVIIGEKKVLDIVTKQHHQGEKSISDVIVKCLLAGQSQLNFTGLVHVGKHAEGTIASLANKNMLLSPFVRVNSRPQLEVLTNDVRCTHGSAVGRYSNEQMAYLAMRGLDSAHSKILLLHGFFGDLLHNAPFVDLHHLIVKKVDALIF